MTKIDYMRAAATGVTDRRLTAEMFGAAECRGREMEVAREQIVRPRLKEAHDRIAALRAERRARRDRRDPLVSARIVRYQRLAQARAARAEAERNRPVRTAQSIARRARAAGLRVERSDRSRDTYYLRASRLSLRISAHELGYADYGTRRQCHKGPEVVFDRDDSVAEIIDFAINDVRDFASALDQWDRPCAARMLRALRLMRQRAARSKS